MPKQQKRRPQSRQSSQKSGAPSRSSRLNVAFVVVSSLVICSLLAAGLVGAIQLDLLGNGDEPDDDVITNPNDSVIADAQTAVAEDPENFEQLLLLGNLLGNSGRVNEAIPVYEKAIALRPEDASARFSFARVLDDGGKQADAEVQYLKSIELDPDYQAAHYYLAEMYRLAQPSRASEAIPHYHRVIELDEGTFMADQARNQLVALGAMPAGSPLAATPSS